MNEPKKLYEVEVKTVFYVAADSQEEAEEMAADAISMGDVDLSDEREIEAWHVKDSMYIEKAWADVTPQGGDKPCYEMADEWREYERTRPRTAEELEAAGQQRLVP
jgi:DNA primase large subunit